MSNHMSKTEKRAAAREALSIVGRVIQRHDVTEQQNTPQPPRFEVIRNDPRGGSGNAGYYVEVRDNLRALATDQTIRRARDTAKRSVPYPGNVTSSNHTGRHLDYSSGHPRMVYDFIVFH